MDLELDGRSILLNLGDARVCASAAEFCLAEGANVAIVSPDETVFVGVKSALVKRYGLKIRCIPDNISSAAKVNLIFDSIERWGAPLDAIAVDWTDYENGPGAQSDTATAKFEAISQRLTPGSSFLFLDTSIRFPGPFDLGGDPAFASLNEKVRDWSRLGGGRGRVNLLCLGGALGGRVPQPRVDSSSYWQIAQTVDEAVGKRVAFMLSSMSGFFKENVTVMAESGVVGE